MRLWRKLRGGTACVRVAPIRPVASASAPLRNELIRCPPRASWCPCLRRHRAFERRLTVERTRDGIAAASGRRWITIGISGVALTRTRIMSTRHPYHLLTDSRARRSEAILWLAHHHTACPAAGSHVPAPTPARVAISVQWHQVPRCSSSRLCCTDHQAAAARPS